VIEALLPEPARAIEGALEWVDARFGPFHDFRLRRLPLPEPAWWCSTCQLARAPAGALFTEVPAGASGCSTSPAEAQARMLGEALERYSGFHAADRLQSAQLLPSDALGELNFPVCHADEPCLPSLRGMGLDHPIPHFRLHHLADERPAWIPAAYVDLSFRARPGEPVVTYPISTGLAFHTDLHEAVWSGLCEVAERDATMIMWWCRKQPTRIRCDTPGTPAQIQDRLHRLRRAGMTADILEVCTSFPAPVVVCILRAAHYPYLTFGSCCHSDPLVASLKSLDEAVMVRQRGGPAAGVPSVDGFDWVHSWGDHVRLYADRRMWRHLDFLLDTRRTQSYEEFAGRGWVPAPRGIEAVRGAARRLQSDGLTVIWAEITAPEVRPFGHVVRVVVPQMVPLSATHQVRWLGTARLWQMAGFRSAALSDFNPYPHPFA
jgi:ribosomal protein S12 methylthiotransferase accessory factor